MNIDDQLMHALMRPGVLPDSAGGVELIETHISWVLLAGEYAWKLKKPLDLGFLDFSTLERRREACEDELRLNQRTLPEVYQAVVPVWRTTQGIRLGAAGEGAGADVAQGTLVDYLVRMRRFDQAGLFSNLLAAGQLEPTLFDRLARHVAEFHAAAAVAQPGGNFGNAAAVHAPVQQNFDQIRERVQDPTLLAELARVEAWATARFAALESTFDARLAEGRVRECHGDMHLGNLIVLDGEARLFDAIEFSAALRWTDVIADVAFLVMDLQARGEAALGGRFLNAWLERSGDYAGLRVLPYYLSYRAMVRAKIGAIRATQLEGEARAQSLAECGRYLALAAAQMRAPAPALLIASGLSGAGKTSQSQPLLESHEVIRVRADVERKRLFGLVPEARSGSDVDAGLYTAEASARTYARLAQLARAVVEAGYAVLVDASFLKRAQRQDFAALADVLDVPFVILAFDAPLEILRARVRQRAQAATDASEADLAVLDMQCSAREAFDAGELARTLQIDTRSAPDWQALAAALSALWPAAVPSADARRSP